MKPRKSMTMRKSRISNSFVRSRSLRRKSARRAGRKKTTGSSSPNLMDSAKGRLESLGNNISNEKIQHLAQGVHPQDIQNEQKMRQLVYQVSRSFNIPVDEKTVNELVRTLKTTDLNQVGSLLGNFLK
jgi:transposase